jgi:ribosomal protein L37AE/L43A
MKTENQTPQQFRNAFRTEAQCRAYIFSRKYPEGFSCRRCKHDQYHEIQHRGGSWQCQSCGYQESATAWTVFHKTKVPLVKWFQAIGEITIAKGGISAVELQHRLGLGTYRAAWSLLHKLRCAMGLRDEKYQLKDEVELDGAVFGRRTTGTETKVYIAIESKEVDSKTRPKVGFAKATVVESFDGEQVRDFGVRNLEPLTEVRTDGGPEVEGLEKDSDLVLNAQVMNGDRKKLDKHLPWVHTLISNIKSALVGTYHGVSRKYLQLYLDEYIYRFNRRWCRFELQTRLVTACLAAGPSWLADKKA